MLDAVNGAFEMLGAFFVLASVIRLHRDKQVHGVSWLTTAFFTSWGAWNLWFYGGLGLTWSLIGAVALCAMNALWLGQLVYYRRHPI